MRLHVGSGTSRGGLTIFPIWSETTGHDDYDLTVDKLVVRECDGSPDVGTLMVRNEGDKPVLLFEGHLFEGGWQNRMLTRSTITAAQSEQAVEVVCVEQGRWSGGRAHGRGSRRASARVRAGLRNPDRQGEVWRRVGECDARFGASPTHSFVDHVERAGADVDRMVRGLRPFPGQAGLLVAIAGQPVMAEVFDNSLVLKSQFEAIVRAAGMDAIGAPPIETPSRRARRFLDRAARVHRGRRQDAGLGTLWTGVDELAEVAALTWNERDVHLVLTNPRHELVRA